MVPLPPERTWEQRPGASQQGTPLLPLWRDKQSENIIFPGTSYAGGNEFGYNEHPVITETVLFCLTEISVFDIYPKRVCYNEYRFTTSNSFIAVTFVLHPKPPVLNSSASEKHSSSTSQTTVFILGDARFIQVCSLAGRGGIWPVLEVFNAFQRLCDSNEDLQKNYAPAKFVWCHSTGNGLGIISFLN